ncbi:MAG: hypothetical protein QOH26_1081 [Actinomycetota bacterium]|jgi:Xaa-Pro aminopeptidase|nr:hypothetical protein [Actinomycetota bacterium]
MGYLSADPEVVAQHTGFDAWYQSLPAHLSLDGFKSELPVVYVPNDGIPTLLMKEIDRPNVELEWNSDVRVLFHNPYFTFDASLEPTDAVEDVVAAAKSVAAPSARLDSKMPVEPHDRLVNEAGFRPEEPTLFVVPGYHYSITRPAVAASFARSFATIVGHARPRIEALGVTAALAPFLDGDSDDSFGPLDEMLEGAGIDVLVASSPLNVQELTGFPMGTLRDDVWAIVERDSDEVQVLSRRELPWLAPAENRRETDYASRFATIGVIGYEERDLSVAAARGFGIDLATARPATDLLRRWRERRSWRDVPYYVVAADVTLRGVMAALQLVTNVLDRGGDVTELDAYRRYRQTVRGIITDESLPIRVESYFTHTHAGNRSLLPARATDFSLKGLTSLKIDAGLLLYDEFGMYRAVSDITRSVVGSDEGRWLYDLLHQTLVTDAIGSCKPGVTGEEVFRAGMAALEPHRNEIVSAGFAPPGPSLTDGFKRDIGHLLGKQEPATVGLKLGAAGTLEPGMVGAAEFQWPFRDHCIGVEDVFLVTEGEPVNLTRATDG